MPAIVLLLTFEEAPGEGGAVLWPPKAPDLAGSSTFMLEIIIELRQWLDITERRLT